MFTYSRNDLNTIVRIQPLTKYYNMMTSKLAKYLLLLLIPLFSVAMLTACSDDDNGSTVVDPDPEPEPEPEPTLVDIASNDDRFSTLVGIVSDLDLVERLSNEELTVFAPTNEAFEKISDAIPDLTEEDLEQIVTYHLLEGTVPSGDLDAQQDVEMLQGEVTLIQASAAGVTINGFANVVEADITASNGVIHAIDEVLLPKEYRVALQGPSLVEVAENAGNFEILLDLVNDLGLRTTLQFLGPYTAFAPTDEAFGNLPVDPASLTAEQLGFILTYHVLFGETLSTDLGEQQTAATVAEEPVYITSDEDGVVVNGSANVTTADVTEPTNGVIHIVDQVLLPNAFLNTVQVAAKNYNFTTLVGLVSQYPDLVDAVASTELTVFAPTNDAFDKLFENVDPNSLTEEQIAEILLYHTVLGAQVFAGDLDEEQTVESGSEEALYITADSEGVLVNGSSNVTTADVASSNGVIHAVDSVLLPNAFTSVPGIVSKNYELSTLLDLVADREAILNSLSDPEGTFTVFAPTNAAFDAALEAFPDLTEEEITEILTYHVLTAQVLSTDLSDGQTAETLQGEDITVTINDDGVQINNANVVTADLAGTNGVVHIIDAVILPPSFTEE